MKAERRLFGEQKATSQRRKDGEGSVGQMCEGRLMQVCENVIMEAIILYPD